MQQSESGLIELQEEDQWAAKEVRLTDDKHEVPELPKYPNCSSLFALYLQGKYELTAIPLLFFLRIQVLDLSHTSVKSLPKSLPKLVALKKLLLQGCDLFMELSPQVGELKNLEELDLDETQIMDLPGEIGKLLELRQLKVSFYHLSGKKKSKSNILIHSETISNLSQLAELSIDVNPADQRWDDCVEAVVKEVCNSKTLRTLSLYLPKFQLLDSTSLIYPSLSSFRFTVGRHKRRIISRVPGEVDAEFRNWGKCLKFVNGENIPDQIKHVLKHSTSFFLDRHVTAMNLSEFGIENMKGLKFCLLAECNKMETLIDGEMNYERDEDDQSESEPGSVEHVLESLEYLSIYYMENLQSIWKGPNRFGCMSKLKFLALHTCPQLSKIFSLALLENFDNLEEIILEDCPQVTSLVSHSSIKTMVSDKTFLPSLKRLLLLYLPELISISNGLLIAPKLETIGCYNCPKLTSMSKMELSSKNLKMIKGECKWWEDMNWNVAEWGFRPDHLMLIFSPIDNVEDVMSQLVEDKDVLGAAIQNEGQQQVDNEKDVITKSAEDRSLVETTIENEDQQPANENYDMSQLAKDKDLFETPIENEGQQLEYAGITEVPMHEESQQSVSEQEEGLGQHTNKNLIEVSTHEEGQGQRTCKNIFEVSEQEEGQGKRTDKNILEVSKQEGQVQEIKAKEKMKILEKNDKGLRKIVLSMDLHDVKYRQKALKIASGFLGVESLSVDRKANQLTLIGNVDPVLVVRKLRKHCNVTIVWKLRKHCNVTIVSVGPAEGFKANKEEVKTEEKESKLKDRNIEVFPAVFLENETGLHNPDKNSCNVM